jgi:hypothetical protein
MKFSEVFVIVLTRSKGTCFNDRIYTTRDEAVDVATNLCEFDWVVISLDEYNDERWSFGYDEGYDNRIH